MLRWYRTAAFWIVGGFTVFVLAAQAIGHLIPNGQLALFSAPFPGHSVFAKGQISLADVDRGLSPVLYREFGAEYFSVSSDWSTDGQQVAVTGGGDIYVISMQDFQLRNVSQSQTYNEIYPRWSPDGRLLAFVRGEKSEEGDYKYPTVIGVMDMETGQNIYHSFADEPGQIYWSPVWAADSKTLAFVIRDDFNNIGKLEILKVNPGQLVTQFEYSEHPPRNLQWSPDGRWLAFESSEYKQVTENGQTYPKSIKYIWLLDANSGDVHSIVEGQAHGPIWSPDSQHIAYMRGESYEGIGYSLLMILDIETGETRQLTSRPESTYDPVWSPDGSWVAVLSSRGGQKNVDMFNAFSGERQHLATITGSSPYARTSPPLWSSDGRWLVFFTDYYLNNTYSVPRTYVIDVVNRSLPFNFFEHQIGFMWQP